MKNNVDLTENHDFQKGFMPIKRTFKQMIGEFKYEHERLLEPDEYLVDSGLIYQGNKQERAIKKLTNSFNDGIECDRCGSPIIVYDNDTLCRKCRKELYYSAVRDNMFWLQ